MEKSTAKVFISYSWTSSERVLELAERLMSHGVNVVLDKWDLKEGQDKYAFMEKSVNDPSVTKVLIICDKIYMDKANYRTGGVGDETVIISPVIYGQVSQEKFIPIIFEVNEDGKPYLPAYIKSRIFIDLSTEDNKYEEEYEKLLRNILNKPLYKKPALGIIPEWIENDTVDLSRIRDLIKQVRGYTGGNSSKSDFLIRKAKDEFVVAAKSFRCSTDYSRDQAIIQTIEQMKPYRDLFVDYIEAIIYSNLPLADTITTIIEDLYNELHDASVKGSYSNSDFELSDFLLWELFISVTAILLHYEKFQSLYEILSHPYFLRETFFDRALKPYNYSKFRTYCRTIEEVCKPKSNNPNLFTLTGQMLVQREKKPVLTKETLSNADIVLYQMHPLFNFESEGHRFWFPTSYIYHSTNQAIWIKMISLKYCQKIMPLFGVNTIKGLKEMVAKSVSEREMHYSGVFDCAPSIQNSIKVDSIATLA